MKAIVFDQFGGPEVLSLRDVPSPVPGPTEVLVDIAYTAVNPVDWKIRDGHLQDALPHVFPIIPGWDAAGTVSALGAKVTRFKVGDRVYAYCRKPSVQWGTYAEQIALEESMVALMPTCLSFAEAAALPLTALTAWQALHEVAQLKKGQTLFVSAGAGGVGGLAIQFAKQIGATVITTASTGNLSYVKELGADRVVDYTKENTVRAVREVAPAGVDVAFDCVGGQSLDETYALVKPEGYLVSIVSPPDSERCHRLGIRGSWHFVAPSGASLAEIAALIDSRAVRPPALEEMPLERAREAMIKNQDRHVRGKIVLKVR